MFLLKISGYVGSWSKKVYVVGWDFKCVQKKYLRQLHYNWKKKTNEVKFPYFI